MKVLLDAIAFFVFLSLSSLYWYELYKNKIERAEIEDVLNCNLKEKEYYNIFNISKALEKMTSVQINHFNLNNATIKTSGYLKDAVGQRSYYCLELVNGIDFYCYLYDKNDVETLQKGDLVTILGTIKHKGGLYLYNGKITEIDKKKKYN